MGAEQRAVPPLLLACLVAITLDVITFLDEFEVKATNADGSTAELAA